MYPTLTITGEFIQQSWNPNEYKIRTKDREPRCPEWVEGKHRETHEEPHRIHSKKHGKTMGFLQRAHFDLSAMASSYHHGPCAALGGAHPLVEHRARASPAASWPKSGGAPPKRW